MKTPFRLVWDPGWKELAVPIRRSQRVIEAIQLHRARLKSLEEMILVWTTVVLEAIIFVRSILLLKEVVHEWIVAWLCAVCITMMFHQIIRASLTPAKEAVLGWVEDREKLKIPQDAEAAWPRLGISRRTIQKVMSRAQSNNQQQKAILNWGPR